MRLWILGFCLMVYTESTKLDRVEPTGESTDRLETSEHSSEAVLAINGPRKAVIIRQGREQQVEGGIDFSAAELDAETGKRCILKPIEVNSLERQPILECTHKNVEQCHYTYVTKFTPTQEQVCEENFKKQCQITFKQQAVNETVQKCYKPVEKVCNGEGPEECRTIFESSCTTKYVERQPGRFVGDTNCEKLPVQVCGKGCVYQEQEQICHDKVLVSLVEVPEEHCDLNPEKICRFTTKLVPRLTPKPECTIVPRESCHLRFSNPKPGKKPLLTKWCLDESAPTPGDKYDESNALGAPLGPNPRTDPPSTQFKPAPAQPNPACNLPLGPNGQPNPACNQIAPAQPQPPTTPIQPQPTPIQPSNTACNQPTGPNGQPNPACNQPQPTPSQPQPTPIQPQPSTTACNLPPGPNGQPNPACNPPALSQPQSLPSSTGCNLPPGPDGQPNPACRSPSSTPSNPGCSQAPGSRPNPACAQSPAPSTYSGDNPIDENVVDNGADQADFPPERELSEDDYTQDTAVGEELPQSLGDQAEEASPTPAAPLPPIAPLPPLLNVLDLVPQADAPQSFYGAPLGDAEVDYDQDFLANEIPLPAVEAQSLYGAPRQESARIQF